MTNWSKEQDEVLISRLRQGFSYNLIGQALGRSKNACIGRARRIASRYLTIQERESLFSRSARDAGALARRVRRRLSGVDFRNQRANGAMALQRSDTMDVVTSPGQQFRCDILRLTSKTCRYPVTDDKPFLFCGAPRQNHPGIPYCAFHARIAYQPMRRV